MIEINNLTAVRIDEEFLREISQKVFNRLSEEQKKTLARLAEDLSGRIWPDAGKVLQQRIQQIGEEEILRALRKLFKVAEGTMRKFALPRVGKLFKT